MSFWLSWNCRKKDRPYREIKRQADFISIKPRG
jgi:hypothetical protein